MLTDIEFRTNSAEKTIELGSKIGSFLKPGDILAMKGTLAAGKTTITKGIALALGIKENITSPTFCLISEYEAKIPLYHMDVYRLEGGEDFLNLGVEELLYGQGVCVIEWSEKVEKELPKRTITISIIPEENTNSRKISIKNWPYEPFEFGEQNESACH